MPILPLLVGVSVGGVVEWSVATSRRNFIALLWLVLLVQGALILPTFGNIVARNPFRLVLRQVTDAEFLRWMMSSYDAVEYLNGIAQPGDWVVGEGVEPTRYYLKPYLLTAVESRQLRSMLVGSDDRELASRFSRAGVKFLLVNRLAANEELPFLRKTFLESFARLDYESHSTEVYRLSEPEREKR